MMPGSSVLITNVKPMWSSSEIKQLLATSGSELKVLKPEKGSIVSDDEKEIKFETLGNIRKGIGREREISRDGYMASGIDTSTSTTLNDDFRSVVPEELSLITNEKGFAQPHSNVSDRSIRDGIESGGPAISNSRTDVGDILDTCDVSEKNSTPSNITGSNTSSILLSQSDNFSCTPFRYYDSNSPLKPPIKVRDISSNSDINVSSSTITASEIEVVKGGSEPSLNGDGSCFLNTNKDEASIEGGKNQVNESGLAKVKRGEKICMTTFRPEQPINLRACINSLPDATPIPFPSHTKTPLKNSCTDFSIKHVKREGNFNMDELHGKEEASILCTIIGWKDDVSGLHSRICDRLRDTETVSETCVMDHTKSRRSKKSRPNGRISLSVKENVLDKFDISSISNLEIHCLNERSGMGVILDYRVHTVLLSSLRNTWLVPGKRIQIVLALLSQIDVINDLIRLTRSDHTVVSSLDDVDGEMMEERWREEREKERGCRQLYKWSHGRCDGVSVEVNNASRCERESALETERRRYEALCLNKVHYESPFNLSFEGCARHRVNCVTIAAHIVIPATVKHRASEIAAEGRDLQLPFFTDDAQLQSDPEIVGKSSESQGRDKENYDGSNQEKGVRKNRNEKRLKADEASTILKKQNSPPRTRKAEDKFVQRMDFDGKADIADKIKEDHAASSKNVLISVEKGRSTVIMEIRWNLLPPQLRAICSLFGDLNNPSYEFRGDGETTAARSGHPASFDVVYTEVWRSDHFIPNFKQSKGVRLGSPQSRRHTGASCITSPNSIRGTGEVEGVRMGVGMERRPRWRVVWMEERNTNSV